MSGSSPAGSFPVTDKCNELYGDFDVLDKLTGQLTSLEFQKTVRYCDSDATVYPPSEKGTILLMGPGIITTQVDTDILKTLPAFVQTTINSKLAAETTADNVWGYYMLYKVGDPTPGTPDRTGESGSKVQTADGTTEDGVKITDFGFCGGFLRERTELYKLDATNGLPPTTQYLFAFADLNSSPLFGAPHLLTLKYLAKSSAGSNSVQTIIGSLDGSGWLFTCPSGLLSTENNLRFKHGTASHTSYLTAAANLQILKDFPGATVFPPENAQLTSVFEDSWDPKNPTELQSEVIKYSVIPNEKVTTMELKSGKSFTTLQGETLQLSEANDYISGDGIVTKDGIIHRTKKVLVPPSLKLTPEPPTSPITPPSAATGLSVAMALGVTMLMRSMFL